MPCAFVCVFGKSAWIIAIYDIKAVESHGGGTLVEFKITVVELKVTNVTLVARWWSLFPDFSRWWHGGGVQFFWRWRWWR